MSWSAIATIDGVEGVDHERCKEGLGDKEPPEDDGDGSSRDDSHCFCTEVAGSDTALKSFSSKVSCSLFNGTMSLNHSSSSWEGVVRIAGFRRNTLYGDER